jgi:hypothetical protein
MPTEPRSMRAIETIDAALVPSLPIVEEALQREDASYRRRADGLDTKAGVIRLLRQVRALAAAERRLPR